MKGNEKEEEKAFRNTIGFEKALNNTLSITKKEAIENRARSFVTSNKKLLQKYIPKLKPIETDLIPSPIVLKGKNEKQFVQDNYRRDIIKGSNKKYLHKLNNVEIEEEINPKIINSTDEECNKIHNNDSDSSDNESKDNERKSNKNNLGSKKDNIIEIKNKVKYCINTTRKKLDKIRNKIKINKYKDDSNLDFYYERNLTDNYKIRCIQNYIEQSKMEKMEEYEKYKNKTISFRDMNLFKPPILAYLEKKEISNNSTLSSSCNFSEV